MATTRVEARHTGRMSEPFSRLERAIAGLDGPVAVLDEPALWANADDLVRRAGTLPVRVASKSVRVSGIIEGALAREGFAGVLSYALAEANWLADSGVDNILLAYPSTDRAALRQLHDVEPRRAAITVMVDDIASLDFIDATLGTGHQPIRVCLDVDASLRIGPVHLGVRRSPVHSARDAGRLAAAIAGRRGFTLVGLMFYDAQIAGLPDSSRAVRMLKSRSATELLERRSAVVEAVRGFAQLDIVNAGGTGSLEVSGADPVVTELSAGSGLFNPTLFDGYDAWQPRPAAYYALSVVRKPAPRIATVYSGGYIASGPSNKNRQPTPSWPPGLRLLRTEGGGEVQTPVRGSAARALRLGDRVWMRHAKAGEMCERFDRVEVVAADGSRRTLPTYRGEGKNFG